MQRLPVWLLLTVSSSLAACGDGDKLAQDVKGEVVDTELEPTTQEQEDANVAVDAAADAAVDAAPAEPVHPKAGELVITEVQPHPAGYIDDSLGEWVELYNPGSEPYSLTGCILSDAPTDQDAVIGPNVLIAPNSYFVLSSETFTTEKHGFIGDYSYDGEPGLSKSGDSVIITCDGVVVDSVTYPAFKAADKGRTVQLDPSKLDATQNDSAGNWCLGTAIYITRPETEGSMTMVSNFGTPKAANQPCM